MGQSGSSSGLAASLLKHSVERLDPAAAAVPFSSLYQPSGAVVFLVRRMG